MEIFERDDIAQEVKRITTEEKVIPKIDLLGYKAELEDNILKLNIQKQSTVDDLNLQIQKYQNELNVINLAISDYNVVNSKVVVEEVIV